ncbi:MAG: AbrB family transcriptional regulator [bacterium]
MTSSITSRFQTTIPTGVRKGLRLSVHDTLEWKIEKGAAVVTPFKKPFLKYKNCIKVGEGDIAKDINNERESRTKRYR